MCLISIELKYGSENSYYLKSKRRLKISGFIESIELSTQLITCG